METEIKSTREVYLDLAKFFAMLMMVAGHSFFEFANPEFYNLKIFPWDWWNFARGKTAPMFLFLSGAVHVFANFKGNVETISKNVFKKRIIMALVLLIIGYTLNSPVNNFSELFEIDEVKLGKFIQVNILHIFSISLLILALIYRFASSEKKVLRYNLALTILFIMLAPLTAKCDMDFLPKFISNYFNYNNGSIFTLIPYSAYMFSGTVFGILLRRKILINRENENSIESNSRSKIFNAKTGLIILVSGIFLIITGIVITKLTIHLGMRINLRNDIGVVVRNIGIILSVIFLARRIKIRSNLLNKYIGLLSKRALFIYVIHLFIIYGIGNLPGLKHFYNKMFEPPVAFLMSFLVIILSVTFTLLLDKGLQYKWFKYLLITIFMIYSIVFFAG